MCAFCFFFHGDRRFVVKGQIAHIDRDSSHSVLENGAYLCKDHHDDYDTRPSQSKRFSPGELIQAQKLLHDFVRDGGLPTAANTPKKVLKNQTRRGAGVSIEVYDRRLAIYKTTIAFLREVTKDLRPVFPTVLKFTRDTEEALFLFDESIATYLELLSTNAFRLHFLDYRRTGMVSDEREMADFHAVAHEQTVLAVWFSEQYVEARKRFAPFLRLA
jgi:hypothetical protein